MKKITVSLVAATALTMMPVPSLLTTIDVAQAVATQQKQNKSEDLMSLGATLSGNQLEQTKRLLGGTGVSEKNTIRVDGTLINRYLNDGSDATTPVYSSALIQPQSKGYGVQVQIVTPQNIQQVSQATYQNAAITAGAKDVLVRVATVLPVTGEGALAGVYALLAQTGKELKPNDVKIADKEIVIINQINNIVQNKEINNININMLIADIKIFVINQLAEGNDPSSDFETFVRDYLVEQGYSDEEINQLLQDEEFMGAIRELIDGFKQTDAAQDQETAEQLEKSLIEDMGRPWVEILPTLTNHPSREELAKEEPTELNLDDETLYHPAIKAMYNQMRSIIESGEGDTRRLYSHTFIYEALRPNTPPQEHQALNLIRTLAYYNMAASLDEVEANLLRDALMGEVQDAGLKVQENPEEATAIQAIANATGLAPQAYRYYGEEPQEEHWLAYRIENPEGAQVVGHYAYDTKTQEVLDLDNNNQPINLTYSFEEGYGVAIENEWIPYAEIAAVNPEVEESSIEQEQSEEEKEEDKKEEDKKEEDQKEEEKKEEPQEEESEESSDDIESLIASVEEEENQQEEAEETKEEKEEPQEDASKEDANQEEEDKKEDEEEKQAEESDDIDALIASMEQEEENQQEEAEEPEEEKKEPQEDANQEEEDKKEDEEEKQAEEVESEQEESDDIDALIASMEQEDDQPAEEQEEPSVEEEESPADEPSQEQEAQSSLSWSPSKQAQLDDFVINQWGVSLGQHYRSYTPSNPGDFYGVSLPGEAIELASVSGGFESPLVWVGDSGELQPNVYNVVAVYSDFEPEMDDINEGHLYFMVIRDDETRVFIADQAQSIAPLIIKETQNEEIKQKFNEIAHQ